MRAVLVCCVRSLSYIHYSQSYCTTIVLFGPCRKYVVNTYTIHGAIALLQFCSVIAVNTLSIHTLFYCTTIVLFGHCREYTINRAISLSFSVIAEQSIHTAITMVLYQLSVFCPIHPFDMINLITVQLLLNRKSVQQQYKHHQYTLRIRSPPVQQLGLLGVLQATFVLTIVWQMLQSVVTIFR